VRGRARAPLAAAVALLGALLSASRRPAGGGRSRSSPRTSSGFDRPVDAYG
jgi:hypothetical protein